MGDRLYRIIRRCGAPFRFRVFGLHHLKVQPALFVGNHSGSTGPLQAIITLPVRLHPWVIRDMTDFRLAPAYLYDDFIHPTWHLKGRLGRIVSTLVARLAVWLINGIGSIPVTKEYGLFDGSLRRSLELLQAGRSLLIFPEDAKGPLDPRTGLYPFLTGFAWLCYLHDRANGHPVPVYPFAVHAGRRAVALGAPRTLDRQGDRRESVRRLCREIEGDIAALYRALEKGTLPPEASLGGPRFSSRPPQEKERRRAEHKGRHKQRVRRAVVPCYVIEEAGERPPSHHSR